MRKNSKQIDTKASLELLKMIEVANLIPYSAELKQPSRAHIEKLIKDDPKIFIDKLFEVWHEYPSLISYLKKRKTEKDKRKTERKEIEDKNPLLIYALDILRDFEQFIKTRTLLKLIVEIAAAYRQDLENIELTQAIYQRFRKEPNSSAMPDDIKEDFLFFLDQPYSLHTRLQLFANPSTYHKSLTKRLFNISIDYATISANENHIFSIEFVGSLGEILKHDLRRFKQCIECKKIMWANRLYAIYCSRKCSNRHWQKKYVSDESKRESRNKQRRDTYQSKKELKLGKKRGK